MMNIKCLSRKGTQGGLQVVVYESSYFRFSSENLESARASPITSGRVFFHLQLLPDSMSIYPRLSSNECICILVSNTERMLQQRGAGEVYNREVFILNRVV